MSKLDDVQDRLERRIKQHYQAKKEALPKRTPTQEATDALNAYKAADVALEFARKQAEASRAKAVAQGWTFPGFGGDRFDTATLIGHDPQVVEALNNDYHDKLREVEELFLQASLHQSLPKELSDKIIALAQTFSDKDNISPL